MNKKYIWISFFSVFSIGIILFFIYFWKPSLQENIIEDKGGRDYKNPKMFCERNFSELRKCGRYYQSFRRDSISKGPKTYNKGKDGVFYEVYITGPSDVYSELYDSDMKNIGTCGMGYNEVKGCKKTCENENLCENIEVDCKLLPINSNADNDNNQASCYRTTAWIKKDKEICTNIMNKKIKAECYLDALDYTNNSNVCNLISTDGGGIKGKCYEYFFIKEGKEFDNTCTKYNEIEKKYCKGFYAYKMGDVSMCESLDSGYIKDYCYFNLVKENKSLSMCEEMTTPSLKDTCLLNYSIYHFQNTSNIENEYVLCDKITNDEEKDRCIFWYTRKIKGDIPFCSMIKNSSTRDNCFSASANDGEGWENCELIEDSSRRDDCILGNKR